MVQTVFHFSFKIDKIICNKQTVPDEGSKIRKMYEMYPKSRRNSETFWKKFSEKRNNYPKWARLPFLFHSLVCMPLMIMEEEHPFIIWNTSTADFPGNVHYRWQHFVHTYLFSREVNLWELNTLRTMDFFLSSQRKHRQIMYACNMFQSIDVFIYSRPT